MLLPLLSLAILARALLVRAQYTYTTSCSPYSDFGGTSCPFTPATTSELDSLVTAYCTESPPEYTSEPSSDGKGTYAVTDVAGSTTLSAATCEAALQNLINACTAEYGEGGWEEGGVNIAGPGGSTTVYVLYPCRVVY
jgi:hypothetical protein